MTFHRNRGAARQRVHPEVHREALQFFACQPRKLDEEARNQETEAVKSYGRFGTFVPLGPTPRCQCVFASDPTPETRPDHPQRSIARGGFEDPGALTPSGCNARFHCARDHNQSRAVRSNISEGPLT